MKSAGENSAKNSVKKSMDQLMASLLVSCLSIFVSIALLFGVSWAWFSDTVSPSKNGSRMVGGNFDLTLQMSAEPEGQHFAEVSPETSIFPSDVWAPGYTRIVHLKITNSGTLPAAFSLDFNFENKNDDSIKLSDLLQMHYTEGDFKPIESREAVLSSDSESLQNLSFGKNADNSDIILDPGDSYYVTLCVFMPKDAAYSIQDGLTEDQLPQIIAKVKLSARQVDPDATFDISEGDEHLNDDIIIED